MAIGDPTYQGSSYSSGKLPVIGADGITLEDGPGYDSGTNTVDASSTGLTIATDAGVGKILTSDGSGVGAWAAPPAGSVPNSGATAGVLLTGDGADGWNVSSDAYGIPTGRGATIKVASDTSSDIEKAEADYVLSNATDQATMNAAIAALPAAGTTDIYVADEATEKNQGGTLELASGVFDVRIDLSGLSNITVKGQGTSTVVLNSAVDGSNAIQAVNAGSPAYNRIVIRDLLIQGNGSSGDGIYLQNVNYQQVLNVTSQKNGGSGIHFKAGVGLEDKVISGCNLLFNDEYGIELEDVHETLISGCHMEENDLAGLYTNGTYDLCLSNCSIEDNYGSYQWISTDDLYAQIGNVVFEGDIDINNGTAMNFSNCHWLGADITAVDIIYINNCLGEIDTITAPIANITGCYITNRPAWNITDCLNLSGNTLLFNSLDVTAGADNVRITIDGNNLRGGTVTIDATGRTEVRVSITGNNTRSTSFSVTNAHVNMSSNFIAAGATLTFNAVQSLNLNCNTLWESLGAGMTIILDNACVGPLLMGNNNIIGAEILAIIDNSGKLIMRGNGGYIAPGEIRTATVSLDVAINGAIGASWHNPEAQDCYIKRIVVSVNSAAAAAATGKVGIADDDAGTNLGAEFFTAITLDSGGVYDSYVAGDTGAQTKYVAIQDFASATDGWINLLIEANDSTATGTMYIEYVGK